MRRALAIAAFLALVLPSAALAHATLLHASPSFRERLEAPPRVIVLSFDQTVTALPDAIRVLRLDGRNVAGPSRVRDEGHQVVARVPRLARDPYTVRWSAISSDGHVISGVYTFGVGVAAPPPTEAVGANGPTTTEHVVRWVYFVALALLVGGIGFRLLVVRGPLPPAAEHRFFALAGVGAVATINVGIVAFLLRAEDALQLPFERLLYGDLSPIAGGTRFGTAFIAMTLGFALVTAFVYLAWLSDRTILLWPALVLGLGFASGLSLSGHSAADAGSSTWSELADWVHLCAATLWVGGLVQLATVVWPKAPELRRIAFMRFSRLATVCVALLVGAGVYLSILRLPHVSDLWTTGYGQVLLVKLSLVGLALAWGALHQFVAKPLLERGEPGRVIARLPRSLLAESAVAMAVLLAAAVLVDSKPPPQPTPAPPTAAHR
ncbi:MAG TPA: CopD family protein [Gaiellaceae bacterium]|jgi:copper transport protein